MLNHFRVRADGTLGSIARLWVSSLVGRRFRESFPFGTPVGNVTGPSITGLFATLTGLEALWLATAPFRRCLMRRVCGGCVTFLSIRMETLTLTEDDQWFKAVAMVELSLRPCLLAVWFDHDLALYLNSTKGN